MRKTIKLIIAAVIVLGVLVMGLSTYVAMSEKGNILFTDTGEAPDAETIKEFRSFRPQCILVLGCAVWADNQPSPMLQDRLDTAVALYKKGAAPKLLLSGDNGTKEYSEPDCMYKYVLKQGVPEEDIFLDYAGFSTYDSVYRAKAVFCADRMIIVTQKYHLFRALHIARALGIDSKGAAAEQRKHRRRVYREIREVLARDKDFFKCIIRPEPVFLGEKIPVDGDGSVTQLN